MFIMNLCPADPALRASECKALYVFKVNHFENKDLSTMMSVCLSLPQMHPNATLNFCLTFVVHYGHLQVFYNFMLLWSSLLSIILYLSISLPILFIYPFIFRKCMQRTRPTCVPLVWHQWGHKRFLLILSSCHAWSWDHIAISARLQCELFKTKHT